MHFDVKYTNKIFTDEAIDTIPQIFPADGFFRFMSQWRAPF